jgi:hypothetical protein
VVIRKQKDGIVALGGDDISSARISDCVRKWMLAAVHGGLRAEPTVEDVDFEEGFILLILPVLSNGVEGKRDKRLIFQGW